MKQAKKTEVRLMAFFLALVCVVSLLAVQNVLQVRREVDDRTKQYVQDVTLQLARDIDNRLKGIVNALENVGDSVERFDSQSSEQKEFLYRKSGVLGCTSLVITDKNHCSALRKVFNTSDFYGGFCFPDTEPCPVLDIGKNQLVPFFFQSLFIQFQGFFHWRQ